ncbi:MAG: sulfur carrier protein ThiS [Thermoplasmatota archaeon]
MTILVNGRVLDHIEGESINRLLKRLKYNFPLVVIKQNDRIIPSDEFIKTKVSDGDRIDIIHLTSGG